MFDVVFMRKKRGVHKKRSYQYQLRLVTVHFFTHISMIQRVPTLRAFWDLEKTVLHEKRVIGLYCGPLLTLIPPLTHT